MHYPLPLDSKLLLGIDWAYRHLAAYIVSILKRNSFSFLLLIISPVVFVISRILYLTILKRSIRYLKLTSEFPVVVGDAIEYGEVKDLVKLIGENAEKMKEISSINFDELPYLYPAAFNPIKEWTAAYLDFYDELLNAVQEVEKPTFPNSSILKVKSPDKLWSSRCKAYDYVV